MTPERLDMPWQGPDEPPEVSAVYDDTEHVLFSGGQFDDPSAPWLVRVTWEPVGSTWRPVEVSLRSTTGQRVTASLWRHVPVTRAVRWSSARLRALGVLAAKTASPETRDALTSRNYGSANDGRVMYDAEHWDHVVEAWNAAEGRHDRRRAVASYLRDRWPDDPRYRMITSPTSTAVKGWLDRLAKEGRITRSATTQKGDPS